MTDIDLGKKAEGVRWEVWSAYESACEAEGADGCEHTPDGNPLICWSCRERKFELVAESRIAAALAEARAEGRKEALGEAVPLKDLIAEALDESRREGAERERWANHQIAAARRAQHEIPHPCGEDETIRLQVGARWQESNKIASEIRARGPMRGPEEE